MQKKRMFHGGRWFSIGIVLFAAVVGLLAACDDQNNSSQTTTSPYQTSRFTYGCDGEENTPPKEDNTKPTVKDERPLIPHASWTCGMPDGIPSPESGELVFEAEMTLGNIRDMGQTQYGQRDLIEVTGGTVRGPKITAEVLTGGLDYQLTLSNGAMEIDQVNVLKTSDGNHIYFRTCGASANRNDVRIVPDFEAPESGAYNFLNSGKFAGTRELDVERKVMKLKVYDVSMVKVDSATPGAVRVGQPEDAPDQSFDCREATSSESKGAELISETVTLAPTIEVGESKNGLRKIAPITGGTVTGKITGKVLFGGADYQLFTQGENNPNGIFIDARYTIEADDGELIIIRNCGKVMSPAPSFETHVDGNYSYLNNARWLSSFPRANLAQTQVELTIYESR